MDSNIEHVATIVSAFVSNNPVPPSDMPNLIASVSAALSSLGQPAPVPEEKREPAVNPKRSVFPDYLVSLENGKQFKSLKRHLSTLGMTPADYRAKWGLPRDYPMVAASYAARRSELAKSIGLGRKAKAAEIQEAPAAEPAPAPEAKSKRGRKKAVATA